jgi:hypothetical protein
MVVTIWELLEANSYYLPLMRVSMGSDSVGVMVLVSQEPGDALMIEEKVLVLYGFNDNIVLHGL